MRAFLVALAAHPVSQGPVAVFWGDGGGNVA